MADLVKPEELDEMLRLLGSVRMITLLQICRLAMERQRPKMAAAIGASRVEATGMCADILRDLEHRRSDLDDGLVPAFCQFFNVSSVALLGVGRDPEADRFRAWMTKEEIVTARLDRRRLLVMGMAGAAGKLLPVSPLVAAAHSLVEVGRPEDRKIGPSHITTARDTATDLAVAYAAAPTADAVRAAKAHAYTLFSLLKPNAATMGDTVRRDLQAVASDAAALAGCGDLHAGRHADADRWFACALELARAAHDRRLEALALVHGAWAILLRPDPDQKAVVEALGAAVEFHPVLPPLARAYVFGGLARERAVLGDDLVSGRFLERSRAASALAPYEEPGWGHLSTHGELAGWDAGPRPLYEGLRSLRLGRPAEALTLFAGELATTARPLRRACLHWDVMEACVALGDPERACASAVAALDESRGHELARLAAGIRETRATFPGHWQRSAHVRELDERLRLAA